MAARNSPQLKGLERLAEVAGIAVKNAAVEEEPFFVDIAKIFVKKNPRKTFEGIDELALSIKKQGLLQPVVVHEEPDGRYRLIIGERRLRAHIKLGLHEIQCLIRRGLDEAQIRKIQVTENKEREDLLPFDEAESVAECVAEFGMSEACEIWGHDKSWVSKRATVFKHPEEVQDLLRKGLTADFEIVSCMAQIRAKFPEAFSREYKKIVDGYATRKSVRDALTKLKEQAKATPKATQVKADAKVTESEADRSMVGEEKVGSDMEATPKSPVTGSEAPSKRPGKVLDDSSSVPALHEQALSLAKSVDMAIEQMASDPAVESSVESVEFTLYRMAGLSVLPILQKVERDRAEAVLRKLIEDLIAGGVEAVLTQLRDAERPPAGWTL